MAQSQVKPGESGQVTPQESLPSDAPAELKAVPKQVSDWALRQANKARDEALARQRLEEQLAEERAARERAERVVADLSASRAPVREEARPDGRADDRVSREFTEEYGGTRRRRRLQFDPWTDPDPGTTIAQFVDERLTEASRLLWDGYLRDRQELWKALTQQQGMGVMMAMEAAELLRKDPQLSVRDLFELSGEAPKYGYSLSRAYESRFQDRTVGSRLEAERAKIREEERQRVIAELNQKGVPPAPPVLGPGAPVPRRRAETRPRSYAEATRMAYESSRGNLLRES